MCHCNETCQSEDSQDFKEPTYTQTVWTEEQNIEYKEWFNQIVKQLKLNEW